MEAITQLVGQLADAWNRHDLEAAARLFSTDYQGMDISETAPRLGRQGAREWIRRYLSAFPDLQFTPGQTIVQGNQAAVSWMARGTHHGYLLNIPPTGRSFTVRGVSFFTIEDNLIQRGEYIWDLAELLRCLRLLPDLYERA
jgi:steroid delta-isomerase-like uncharacterized protein